MGGVKKFCTNIMFVSRNLEKYALADAEGDIHDTIHVAISSSYTRLVKARERASHVCGNRKMEN